MPILTHTIGLLIARAETASGLNFRRDVSDPDTSVVSTRYPDFTVSSVSLAADGTVKAMDFGGMQDVRGAYLEISGGDANLWLNQSSVDPDSALLLSPASPTAPAHIYLDTKLSSVQLASAQAVVLDGVAVFWGFAKVTA